MSLSNHNSALPSISANQRPYQMARLIEALTPKSSPRFSIIVTDSAPLITLAASDALDTLLKPVLPVIIPDIVRFDIIRSQSQIRAKVIADWIRAHEGRGISVTCTEAFEEYLTLLAVNASTKMKTRGEDAAGEIVARHFADGTRGAILLFEDTALTKRNFLLSPPDNVILISTSAFLRGLQAAGL